MEEAKFTDFVPVKVAEVGFADEDGLEGLVLLKAQTDETFTMRAFSGETAMHMSRFDKGDRSSIPSVYNIIEEFAEKEASTSRASRSSPRAASSGLTSSSSGRGRRCSCEDTAPRTR